MSNETLRNIGIGIGITAIISAFIAFGIQATQLQAKTRPAGSIEITDEHGGKYWTNRINFSEDKACVVFTALPSSRHTAVCGNYRMEGMQNAR